MSRNRLFVIAAVLAITSFTTLIFGISLQHKDIRSFIASHYREYAHDAGGTRYLCTGSSTQVADTLAGYQSPAARASSAGSQYLRYDDAIVSVGPDGDAPLQHPSRGLGRRLQPRRVHFPRSRLLPRLSVARLRRQHRRPGRDEMTPNRTQYA